MASALSPVSILCRLLSPEAPLSETYRRVLTGDSELWKQIIRIASRDLVLPSIYPALSHKFENLQGFDPELVAYLHAAYDLNEERNALIRAQILEMRFGHAASHPMLLLKGACSLFRAPTSFPHSRILGDVDILIHQDELYQAVASLIAQGYTIAERTWYYDHLRTLHYPPLLHPRFPAIVELHEHPISPQLQSAPLFASIAASATVLTEAIGPTEEIGVNGAALHTHSFAVPSNTFRVLHNMRHALIGESGFYRKRFPLRQLHDFCLLAQAPGIDWQEIERQFVGPLQREMLAYYLHLAKQEFGWGPPRTLANKTSLLLPLRSTFQSATKRERAVTVALAAVGALSTERLHSRYGPTRSKFQLHRYRLRHLAHLLRKFKTERGRKSLLRAAGAGVVQTRARRRATADHLQSPATEVRQQLVRIPVEESTLLVDTKSGASILVGGAAVSIAEDLLAGRDDSDLAAAIAIESGIESRQAAKDVEKVRALVDRFAACRLEKSDAFHYLPETEAAALLQQDSRNCTLAFDVSSLLRLRVICPTELSPLVASCFALAGATTIAASKDSRLLRIARIAGALRVQSDSGHTLATQKKEGLPSLIYSQLQRLLAESLPHELALHGGAFTANGGVTLVLGASGSGKSTLLAQLQGRGMQLLADDLLLLTDGLRAVHPLPVPHSLKQGSWSLLGLPGDPETAFLHPRGARVRYLPLGPRPAAPQANITRFIFPVYAADARSAATALSVTEAIEAISSAGFYIAAEQPADVLQTLVTVLRDSRRIRLTYNSLAEAERLLRDELDLGDVAVGAGHPSS